MIFKTIQYSTVTLADPTKLQATSDHIGYHNQYTSQRLHSFTSSCLSHFESWKAQPPRKENLADHQAFIITSRTDSMLEVPMIAQLWLPSTCLNRLTRSTTAYYLTTSTLSIEIFKGRARILVRRRALPTLDQPVPPRQSVTTYRNPMLSLHIEQ